MIPLNPRAGNHPGAPETADLMKTMREGEEMPKPRVWELLSDKEEPSTGLPGSPIRCQEIHGFQGYGKPP